MNVISISTDRKIFEAGSAVRARMISYGKLFDELHIIIFSKKDQKFSAEKISDTVWIYPTQSRSKLGYMKDAEIQAQTIFTSRHFSKETSIITCQDPFETGHVGVRLKKKLDLALQLQVHTDIMSHFFSKQSFLNKIRVFLAKKNFHYADEIRVVSSRIKQSLQKLGIPENHIDILPIYTDPSKFPVQDHIKLFPEFETTILMASRLSPEKNIESALTVFNTILKSHPRVGLIIIGEGQQKHRLEDMVQKLGITSSVKFLPWQPSLNKFYAGTDIFLLTSIYEGYGLTLIEAGLSETAIVTTDVGIAREYIQNGEHGYVCPVGNLECLTKSLLALIENQELRKKFSSQIRNSILRATISSSEEYEKRYKECLEKALATHQS